MYRVWRCPVGRWEVEVAIDTDAIPRPSFTRWNDPDEGDGWSIGFGPKATGSMFSLGVYPRER